MNKHLRLTLIILLPLIIIIIIILLVSSCSSEREYQEALQVYKDGGDDCYLKATKMLNDIPSYFSPSYKSGIRLKNPIYSKAQILIDKIKESYVTYRKNYLIDTYKKNLIAYLAREEEYGWDYLYINTIDGKNPIKVNFTGECYQPLWSPDGQWVLFYGLPKGEINFTKGYDLFITDREGKTVTRLTNSLGEDREPSWSPDSKKIIFARDNGSSCRVFIYDLDKKREELIYPTSKNPGYKPIENPLFISDQKVLAFFSLSLQMIDLEPGKSRKPFRVADIFGNELAAYIDENYQVKKMALSPDRKALLFIYNRLYRYGFATKEIVEVGEYFTTAFSPDEKYLLYANEDNDGSYLYIDEIAVGYDLPPVRLFKGKDPDWSVK